MSRDPNSPNRTEPADAGCWIDASHFSADYCNAKIVQEAVTQGMMLEGYPRILAMLAEAKLIDGDESWLEGDQSEHLTDLADRAVDWLNDNIAGKSMCFVIEDNSLYLEVLTDED